MRHSNKLILLVVPFLLAGICDQSNGQQTLFALDQERRLQVLDIDTGDLSLTGFTNGFIGLADYEGFLWTADENRLLQLNSTNGQVLSAVNFNRPISGQAFTIYDDVAYVDSFVNDEYLSIDINTGLVNVIGSGLQIQDFDFNSAGEMFGVTGIDSRFQVADLFRIDPMTGTKTLVGSTGLSADALYWSAGGISFDESDNLYWATGERYHTLDTSTGLSTSLGSIGHSVSPSGIFGVSFINAVPEPNSLIGIAFVSIVCALRRRTRV
jgi:hypothetical protein